MHKLFNKYKSLPTIVQIASQHYHMRTVLLNYWVLLVTSR